MASVSISTVTATVTAKMAATTTAASRAAAQGGILEGANPSHYNPKDPIITFIIQAALIIIFTRLLHYPLSLIRQPRVIAEIIGGILLGPSVFGRIPGFSNAIFPTASMPTLSLAANLGLVLFLFLVGLEVDLRIMLSNWKVALSVGAAGMALPFGLGCAIAYGLYHQFREDPGLVPISFGTYMLFVGVAMAITAFPVLCRILTELKLLHNEVGVVVLSAGVGNDVVGWVLLALCVALVNAGSGITALYVLLTAIAYVLFLVYAVRPGFLWILRRTGSIQNGPTQGIVALTILLTLASSFFTGIIGIHPIFGGFVVGLICPHDGGFAIKLTEKVEDLVGVLFLPLYFALSGLNTNIGLLDSGITWAYVIGVIAVAFFGKIVGGTIAARLTKMVWRESLTVGVLMSCKGLVELIVLNIGLNAKILSPRTFTIFVVMALVTTFATTPLVTALYPPWYQKKIAAWRRGEIDWDGNRLMYDTNSNDAPGKSDSTEIRRLLVYLRLDSLSALFTFVNLLGPDNTANTVSKLHPRKNSRPGAEDEKPIRGKPLQVHGLRMFELTERLSSVMNNSEVEDSTVKDPVVNAFHTFGQLNNVATSGEVQIVPTDSFAETLTSSATAQTSDLVLLPWSEAGTLGESGHFNSHDGSQDKFINGSHSEFVKNFLADAPCNVAVLINNGFGGHAKEAETPKVHHAVTGLSNRSTPHLTTMPIQNRSHHIFFPFAGGPDDRVALRFVLRLAHNSNVTATILYVKADPQASVEDDSTTPTPDTKTNTNVVAASVASSASTSPDNDLTFFNTIRDSLPSELSTRVSFETAEVGTEIVARAKADFEACTHNAGNIFVAGRSNGSVPSRITSIVPEVRGTLGPMAAAVLEAKIGASVLVMRASGRGSET